MIRLTTRALVENAIYYGGGGFALWKGDRWVRLATAALLLENAVILLIGDSSRLEDPRYMSLVLDCAFLVLLLTVVFRSDLRWPLLASALQILCILSHVARIIDPTIHSFAYVTVDIGLSFALMAILMWAAFMHMRAKRADRFRA